MKSIHTMFVVVLLVASSAIPVGTAAATQQSEAYAGTHVEFETTSNAIVDYSVNDTTVFESVKVQSQSSAESQGDVQAGVGLSAVTGIAGEALSVESHEVSATVTAESGATMEAHDNSHGILVVESGGESQYVTVNVSSSSQAESENDQHVLVTTEDGTKGSFIVVGDGNVTVNDRGNVSANLGSDGTLVFRSYSDERSEDDEQKEQLISEGKATAEVYVMQAGDQGSEFAADVVQYGNDTTVEVTQQSEGTVQMTAERSQEQGKIIMTSVSEQAISSVEDLQVTVDGEAAAEASSYSDLESTSESDTSKFLVRQESSAQASADVLVAVNHFSERQITMRDSSSDDSGSDDNTTTGDESDGSDSGTATGEESDGSDETNQEATDAGGPGFGIGVTLVALISVALYAYRRY